MCNSCRLAMEAYNEAIKPAGLIYQEDVKPFQDIAPYNVFLSTVNPFYVKYEEAIKPYFDIYLKVIEKCKDKLSKAKLYV